MTVAFNSSLKLIEKLDIKCELSKIPIVKYYSGHLDFPLINELLSVIGHQDYAHRYIDIKPRFLKTGECPCIPGWHTDLLIDPTSKPGNDLHFIYVIGSNSLTEFITDEFNLDKAQYSGEDLLKYFRHQLNNMNLKTAKIEERTLYSFDRFSFHRGSEATYDGLRILIRVTFTNLTRNGKFLGYFS